MDNAEHLTEQNADELLKDLAGILVPGGFGDRGLEGKITAIKYARVNKVPFFGICLGMQCAVTEYARNVLGYTDAFTAKYTQIQHILLLTLCQSRKILRIWAVQCVYAAYPCKLSEDSFAYKAYGQELIYERHRHRYEYNNVYRKELIEAGMSVTGISPNEKLVEIVEVHDHPWFVGVQFHPEFKSRPNRPHPLFKDFVASAIEYQNK